ncbi:MAG TPA: hypothetical protein VGE52_19165, partial [Pirellulales bacterium]
TTAAPLAESHGVSPETDQLLADMLAADKTRRIADYDTLLARIDALPVYHDAYPVPGTGGATTGARTATPAASTIGTLASGAATTRATRSLAHTEYVEAAPSASAAVPLPETTNVASPARRAPVGAIAGGLGIALLLAAGVFFGLRPASLPAKPLEMATGYEQPLFDGRGLEQWLPAQGSWRADVDEEGGAILRGAGVARRPIPPLKNFSVSAAVRPRTAKAVELRFAIRDPSEIDGPCYAIRLADGFATLIERRPGAPGVTLSPVTIPLPDVTEDETRAPYLSIRIERQGDVWWAFCEDQPIGAARVRADEASEIRLTATGGEAFFEEITLAELTDVKK